MLSFDKLTIKSQEALQKAQQLASDYGQQQIEPLHLLLGVLDSPESIARSVFKKTGVDPDMVKKQTMDAVELQRRKDQALAELQQES